MVDQTPEDVMALIEGQSSLADVLDGMKQQLISRGWSQENAELSAMHLMIPVQLAGLAAQLNNPEGTE